MTEEPALTRKLPGITGNIFTVCLLAAGAAREKVKGISHLFEHILIDELLNEYNFSHVCGYTTEDYVILFCKGVTPGKIMETLIRMKFTGEKVLFHKQFLIKEIQKKSINDEEAFFPFLWQGTDYTKSPLGTVGDVISITPGMLEIVRLEILNKAIFFYSSGAGLEIFNEYGREQPPAAAMNISRRKNKIFRGRRYNIYYFNRCIEALYLHVGILKDINPDKHIQLSEKKSMSALILEIGTKFPTQHDIGLLRKKSLDRLNLEISGIKDSRDERALNELESIYFHGERWEERIERLSRTTDPELLQLVRELESA